MCVLMCYTKVKIYYRLGSRSYLQLMQLMVHLVFLEIAPTKLQML